MTKNDLYRRVDDLESKLNHERSIHLDTKKEFARIQDKYTHLHGESANDQSVITKQAKELKRLETANKKFMQAIDALKKQLADKEIDRDRYAREVALKLAYAVAKADEHIATHAKSNYQFITNTEPPVLVNTDDIKIDYSNDLIVTHIDEA